MEGKKKTQTIKDNSRVVGEETLVTTSKHHDEIAKGRRSMVCRFAVKERKGFVFDNGLCFCLWFCCGEKGCSTFLLFFFHSFIHHHRTKVDIEKFATVVGGVTEDASLADETTDHDDLIRVEDWCRCAHSTTEQALDLDLRP